MRRRDPSHDHGRDRVLEDELLLTVRLQHHGVLVEGADAARQFHPAEQVNGDACSLFAGRVKEGILNVLRRLIAVHSRSPWLCTANFPACQSTGASWTGSNPQHVPGTFPQPQEQGGQPRCERWTSALRYSGSDVCTIRRSAALFNREVTS